MIPNHKLTRIIAGREIAQTMQEGAALSVEFTDGSVMRIKLEDPASSVIVRNASGQLEYAD